MNETSYYERMSKAKEDKERVLSFIKEGDNFLDFGAGTGDISKSILEKGANYIAIDNSEQAINILSEKGLTAFKSIQALKNTGLKFDVIYLSSVLHEVYSYSIAKTKEGKMTEMLQIVFVDLVELLKDNGLIIIRDFPKIENRKQYELKIKSKYKIDLQRVFLPSFLKNKLLQEMKGSSVFKAESDYISITGNSQYIYELLYHFNWGLQSYARENQEVYGIFNENDIQIICDYLNFEKVVYFEYFSEDYRTYLEDKFILTSDGQIVDWFDNKYFAVLKKSKINEEL